MSFTPKNLLLMFMYVCLQNTSACAGELGSVDNDEAYTVYTESEARSLLIERIKNIQSTLASNDIDGMARNISFPMNISGGISIQGEGSEIEQVQMVRDKEDLRQYWTVIFNPANRSLINCISSKNMTYDPYKGFMAAWGNIWIIDVVESGERKFLVSSLSVDEETTMKWVNQNCPISDG